MAGKAMVRPAGILSMEINDDTGAVFGSTFTVHYVMPGESEEEKDVTAVCAWPTDATSLAQLHQAMRDTVIQQQPLGYDLEDQDVLIPQFVLGSLA